MARALVLALLIALGGFGWGWASGYGARDSVPSQVILGASNDPLRAVRVMFHCPEDTVIVWSGNAHRTCLHLDWLGLNPHDVYREGLRHGVRAERRVNDGD